MAPDLTIKQTDDTTLYLTGKISRGDFAKFNNALTPQITKLIVKSAGGDTYDALRMARRIAPQNMTIIVQGMCISSCANYLFTAARRRVIDSGIVGFHGNITALVNQNGGIEKMLQNIRKDMPQKIQEQIQRQPELRHEIESTMEADLKKLKMK